MPRIEPQQWLIDRTVLMVPLDPWAYLHSRSRFRDGLPLSEVLSPSEIEAILRARGSISYTNRGFAVSQSYENGNVKAVQRFDPSLRRDVYLNPLRHVRGLLDPDPTHSKVPSSAPDNYLPPETLSRISYPKIQQIQAAKIQEVAQTQSEHHLEIVQGVLDPNYPFPFRPRFKLLEIAYDIPVDDSFRELANLQSRVKSESHTFRAESAPNLRKVVWSVRKGETLVFYTKTPHLLRGEVRVTGRQIRQVAGTWWADTDVLDTIRKLGAHYGPLLGEILQTATPDLVLQRLGEEAPSWPWLHRFLQQVIDPLLRGQAGPALTKVVDHLHREGKVSQAELGRDMAAQRIVRFLHKKGVLQASRRRGSYFLRKPCRYLKDQRPP